MRIILTGLKKEHSVKSPSETSTPATESTPAEAKPASAQGTAPQPEGKQKIGASLIQYLLDSEVHTFAFSVAANAILSFIPFIVMLYTLAASVFHSPQMVRVVSEMVHYFMPSNQDFVAATLAAQAPRHGVQAFSLVMILVSCTGIFLPLEVALNRAWRVTKSRNYIHNQVIAFGLAFLMVLLGVACVAINAQAQTAYKALPFIQANSSYYDWANFLTLSITTGIASILFFFSIYWLLPNCKVPWFPVLRTSVVTSILWMGAKYIFVAILPHMHLKDIYGAFYVSVGLLFWAYTSGLILCAGAHFSVSRLGEIHQGGRK
jgi:YihY family inner membrane protein